MSIRYKGGILSATPPTLVAGAGASGAWTLEQQMQATAAGNWPVNGPFYVEDVFSTYLYTGTGSALTITNNIDLSTKGGMVWLKDRSQAYDNGLFDTARGAGYRVISNSIAAQNFSLNYISSFNNNGFSLGSPSVSTNNSGDNYVSWTFRKQAKFFDIVTYTGNGSNRNIAHNLGSAPGCMIIKSTTLSDDWYVFHQSLGAGGGLTLNTTNAYGAAGNLWDSTYPSSTVFRLGTNTGVNQSGQSYVAYLFAHDAGGFGLTGTDNVISCGSYTGNGTTNNITLGYEPQWLLVKRTDIASDWRLGDIMRGSLTAAPGTAGMANLYPNLSSAEDLSNWWYATSTGFATYPSNGSSYNASGGTYIYIAIRRGPMKTPTVGTSVFSPIAVNNAAGTVNTTNFPVDLQIFVDRTSGGSRNWVDRLRGVITDTSTTATTPYLTSDTTNSEATNTGVTRYWNNTGFQTAANPASSAIIYWNFRRAPGFFDEICFTGTGAATSLVSHNLGTTPLLVIVKSRSVGGVGYNWPAITNTSVSSTATLLINNSTGDLGGNSSGMFTSTTVDFGSTTGLASLYTNNQGGNASGTTYVAYLFASCPGVSKVGSYTGTAATQTIDCGFTTGARFVMIKRTDAANIWWVWDSARGITSGNDPYLAMNNNGTEITTTNYVDTTSVGFQLIGAVGPSAVGSYIFLAIA